MENFETKKKSGRELAGIVIIVIGIIFLLDNLGIDFPNWIFGWYTFLIVFGLYLGAKNNFKGSGWFIMVLVGLYFNLSEIPYFDLHLSKYAVSILLLGIGAYLLIKPKNSLKTSKWNSNLQDEFQSELPSSNEQINPNDVIDISAVFGGSNQTVFSKSFKGGDINAVFGGADVNFVQADFNGVVHLNVSAVFGGVKLIVPHNWAVKSNVTALFGSVEDRRAQTLPGSQIEKTLVLDGVAMFGGVEVKSY